MEQNKFKKPDLNAPRNREQVKDFLAYPKKDPHGFFAAMKKQHPQLGKYSNREIARWIEEYNKLMAQEVANSRYGIKLPEGLGAVITGLNKPTEKTASYNIDYNASKGTGIEVPFRNGHTDGYVAKIYYTNNIPRCKFKNRHIWRFKPCRALSRAVSSIMKNEAGYKKYIVFARALTVHDLFRKPKISKSTRRELKEDEARKKMLAQYDEFRFD